MSDRKVVANRAKNIAGIDYEPGDSVDVSDLPEHKVSQLLDQRILRPAGMMDVPATKPSTRKPGGGSK